MINITSACTVHGAFQLHQAGHEGMQLALGALQQEKHNHNTQTSVQRTACFQLVMILQQLPSFATASKPLHILPIRACWPAPAAGSGPAPHMQTNKVLQPLSIIGLSTVVNTALGAIPPP
jgi:hypothetical protein